MVSRAERGALADWFWTIDRFFLAAFILLMGLGFMLSFAASPAVAERLGLDSFHFVKRHAVFLLPAIAVMFGISRLVVRHDVNAFRLIFLWGRTKAANRNRVFWGGSSYTPLPLKGIKRKGFGRNG